MGFFDEMLEKTRNAVNVVGKNAGNLVDSSKLKLHASDLKGDINKSYEALGKLVYEAQKSGADAGEAVKQATESIDELQEQLAAVEAQILKLSNKTVCQNCGETNTYTAQFCSHCGTKLEHPVEAEPVDSGCCGCDCGDTAEAAEEPDTEEAGSSCGCGGCGCNSATPTEEKNDEPKIY